MDLLFFVFLISKAHCTKHSGSSFSMWAGPSLSLVQMMNISGGKSHQLSLINIHSVSNLMTEQNETCCLLSKLSQISFVREEAPLCNFAVQSLRYTSSNTNRVITSSQQLIASCQFQESHSPVKLLFTILIIEACKLNIFEPEPSVFGSSCSWKIGILYKI